MSMEWNAKLRRRLQDSIVWASDKPRGTRILVTDLEDSRNTLVEVLGETAHGEQVFTEFLVKGMIRGPKLRYREEIALLGKPGTT